MPELEYDEAAVISRVERSLAKNTEDIARRRAATNAAKPLTLARWRAYLTKLSTPNPEA